MKKLIILFGVLEPKNNRSILESDHIDFNRVW